MKLFQIRKIIIATCVAGLYGYSSCSLASAFQLWEQDAASIGNYHAGYAASADDASIAFYNPAGISRFKNQQVVFGVDSVLTSFKYRGTVAVNNLDDPSPQPVTVQGGNIGLIPALHYVAPLSDIVGFGFSVVVPFGLKTDYGKGTVLRYASTESSVRVIDISPVLSFKVTDKFSFGFGPDIQVMKGEFDMVGTNGVISWDSDGINTANDTAYGLHAGILYEFNENSRVGLSYHSQVAHHLSGHSSFSGAMVRDALDIPSGTLRSTRAKVDITLPAYTALSAYHKVNSDLALMGSVIYTQWNTIQNLVLQNVAGISLLEPTTSLVVTVPQHYCNTFNISAGADFAVNDWIRLRAGIGFDQTPVNNMYRNVMLPDNNRIAVAFGSHFQSTKTIGFDLGWTHLFMNQAKVNPPAQVTGDQVVTTNGNVNGGADVLAAQIVWDIF
ncbi:MAG TPA: outer membrane protein transport protein [Gammaproteobacteria bacterium]|nr:outer membrane protein transport protein [Gammaproteobacteria bacterium]